MGEELPEHPVESNTVTVKQPEELIVMLGVVAPLLQRYAVIVAKGTMQINSTEPPSQNSVGPLGTITATGLGLTVTSKRMEVQQHPIETLITTENIQFFVVAVMLVLS